MRSSARFQRTGQLDWLDHEEAESLIQTLLKGKPDPKIVNEILGEGFHSRIGQDGAPDGEFAFDVLVEIETQAMDKWLGGEQPLYTKVVRAVRKMRRSAVLGGNSGLYVAAAFLLITIAIWSPIVVGAILLTIALNMYLDGLSGSAGSVLLNNGDAVRLMLYSGGLVFLVTMMFPLAQTLLSWIMHLFPRVKEDWLVDTGRKVSGFTLTLVSVTAIAIILNVPPNVRDFIPLMFLGVVGVGFILISANARSEQSVQPSAAPRFSEPRSPCFWSWACSSTGFTLAMQILPGPSLGRPPTASLTSKATLPPQGGSSSRSCSRVCSL